MKLKSKAQYDLRKPCMGLFLQSGVKALATTEAGLEIAMVVIGTLAIRDMDQSTNGWVHYVIYTYCYFYAVASLFLSQRLFVKSSQRDAKCILKIWLASAILFAVCLAGFIYYTATDRWYPTNLSVFVAYVLFKAYALWVVYCFVSEIKSTEGVNPALRDLTDGEVERFFEGGSTFLGDNYGDLPYARVFEMEKGRIQLNETYILGKGAFGIVVAGYDSTSGKPVAVKKSGKEADIWLFKALLTELKILMAVGPHENIVNLVGAYTQEIQHRNILIVLELCELGNAQDYLRTNYSQIVDYNVVKQLNSMTSDGNESVYLVPPSPTMEYGTLKLQDVFMWSIQSARGMEFISNRKVVHGDLAARNVLLTKQRTAKIADFGLSRELGGYSVYVKTSTNEPLPWRWMSPEALTSRKFSTLSDVWSFGVLLWEFFTCAQIPYRGWKCTPEFIYKLSTTEVRLDKPTFGTGDILAVMTDCLNPQSKSRPSFAQLREKLEAALTAYVDCSHMQGYTHNPRI